MINTPSVAAAIATGKNRPALSLTKEAREGRMRVGTTITELTAREIQVVRLFFNPRMTYNRAADHLQLEVGTLKKHMSNIYQKLGTNSIQEAVAVFLRNQQGQKHLAEFLGFYLAPGTDIEQPITFVLPDAALPE